MISSDKNFLSISQELESLNSHLSDGKSGIPLWSVPRTTAEFLRSLVISKGAKTVLELGTSGGYSTIWLANGASEVGGHVHTIDKEESKVELAKSFFVKAKLDKNITQLVGDIDEVLQSWNKKIDFLFLDADKHSYFSYLKTLEPFLDKGSVIVADNAVTHASKMKYYLDYLFNSKDYYSLLLPFDNGLMVSIKK